MFATSGRVPIQGFFITEDISQKAYDTHKPYETHKPKSLVNTLHSLEPIPRRSFLNQTKTSASTHQINPDAYRLNEEGQVMFRKTTSKIKDLFFAKAETRDQTYGENTQGNYSTADISRSKSRHNVTQPLINQNSSLQLIKTSRPPK